MNRNMSTIFGVMLMAILLVGSAYAPGGITHESNTQDVLASCHTPICKICNTHYAKFLAGIGWVDVTVPYYYTDFNNYQSTHMWVVADECIKRAENDERKAICYGIQAHLAADSAYHNYLIPQIIRKNWWGNDWILHPIQEAIIEDYYIQRRGQTYGFMSALTEDDMKFLNDIVGKDLTNEALFLKDVYGSTEFYTGVYGARSGGNLKYDIYVKAVNVVSNIPILSNWLFYDLSDREVTEAHNRVKTNLNYVFQGIRPPQQNPTGSQMITAADNAVLPTAIKLPFYIVFLIVFMYFMVRVVWWLLKKIFRIGANTTSRTMR